ncbi:hypothetical protein NFI96_022546, partial [Prochilodus magdalenae]
MVDGDCGLLGIHTVQYMYGCELNDDGTKKGYNYFGYDGEDFLTLDASSYTWIAANAKAVITKQRWDPDEGYRAAKKAYLENECIEWLEKYVGYGRSTLERKEYGGDISIITDFSVNTVYTVVSADKIPPEVDLFQKHSSSPVVCHATGFFPKNVMISWKKNGEDLDEDFELRETVLNQDGSFQKRSILTVPPEKLDSDKYTCVIQHPGLEKEMVLQVSDRRVLSGGVPIGIIIAVVVAVLLLVVAVVGVFVWKKKQS